MLFALLLGAALGFVPLDWPWVVMMMFVALAAKAILDILFEKMLLIDRPSPFQIYCHNLEMRGETAAFAWLSYAMQLVAFGMLFGGAAFALVRYLR